MLSRLAAPSRTLFRRMVLNSRVLSNQVSEHYQKDLPENLKPKPEFEEDENFFRLAWYYSKLFLFLGFSLLFLKTRFTTLVIGRSMAPQFNSGASDYSDTVIFVPRIKAWLGLENKLERGQIYLFSDPSSRKIVGDDTPYIIKRCIAIEGDTVLTQKDEKIQYVEIPPGHCWLESDNYTFQEGQYPDSLKFGPIDNKHVWGRVIWSYRRLNIFPTFIPWPENYDFNVPIVPSIPHQRVMLSRNTKDHDFLAVNEMQNLPNKVGMDLIPKGPADKAMEGKTPEEKQGWSYNHEFNLSTDREFLKDLQEKNEKAAKEGVENLQALVPGTKISAKSHKLHDDEE